MAYTTKLSIVLLVSLLVGCPDAPLLTTPLPNGYKFRSNGGWYGYILTPEGNRLSSYFGIIDDKTEAWCEEFGWYKHLVVCKRTEYFLSSASKKAENYLLLNTSSGEIFIKNQDQATKIWQQEFGLKLPALSIKHSETSRFN